MEKKAKYILDPSEIRTYKKDESCAFKKNNEKFGGLSNMSTEFPIEVNGRRIRTVEALYQACRFPHIPELQERIISQTSPMNVKMISNSNKGLSRNDWENVRIKIMKWCINVKLAQNFISFGTVLNDTGLKYIVENSSTDNFWGAVPDISGNLFIGKNALGRLLMELRKNFYSNNRYSLLCVSPIEIDSFILFGEKITVIDERENFIKTLDLFWKDRENNGTQGYLFQDF